MQNTVDYKIVLIETLLLLDHYSFRGVINKWFSSYLDETASGVVRDMQKI